jgi:GT2 family glycosyltransferase
MNSLHPPPDISFITLCYNGLEDTCQLIDSLQTTVRSVSYEVVVVDNASRENEAEKLTRRYPTLTVVRSKVNGGFAAGNNIGLRLARGRLLFFINNDTFVEEDHFDHLVRLLDGSPHIGGLSPKIRFAAPPRNIQYAGFTPLTPITLRNEALGYGHADDGSYDHPHPTPYLHGAAMLLKREAIERVGLMPEAYFLYYEELDWSTRLTRAGYELWYDPTCTIYHEESRSVGTRSALSAYYHTRGRLLYARRNRQGWQRLAALFYLTVVATPKSCLGDASRGNWSCALATLRGTWAGWMDNPQKTVLP